MTGVVAFGLAAFPPIASGAAFVRLASVFCIPGTGNVLIDGAADLPGPGAVTLPVSTAVVP